MAMRQFLAPQVVVAPTFYPVTVDELRVRLGFPLAERDDELQDAIAAATEDVEARTGMALTQRTYRAFMDAWPTAGLGCVLEAVTLPWRPTVSLTHVKTYDDDAVATTFDPEEYFLDTTGRDGRIALRRGCSWPTDLRPVNGIEIEWVAGFADTAAIPARAKSAIVLLARQMFDEDPAKVEPPAVMNLLRTLRSWAF